MLISGGGEIPVKIYKGNEKDIEFIVDMWKKLSDYHRKFEDYLEPSQQWRQYIRSLFLDDMTRNDRLFLVAKEKNNYIGFIRVEIRNTPELFNNVTTGYISDLYVDENYRGSGLADKLMDECIIWIKGKGIENVRLNVNSENKRAINFYQKIGFKEVNKTLYLKI